MKKLKDIALNFILDDLDGGKLKSANDYFDYFDVINSLVEIKKFSEAREILIYLSKFQRKNGDFKFDELRDDCGEYNFILYLNSLAKYLIKVDDKLEIKFFLKILKRGIESLRNYFDENYLLFYNYDLRGRVWFESYENGCFLSIGEEFSDLLNKYDYNKFADEIFMFNGRVVLGFERYFVQKDLFLSRFSKELKKFEGLDNLERLRLIFECDLEKKIFLNEKKIIERSKNDFDHFLLRLYYYSYLKKEKKDFKKLIKDDSKYLIEIPTTLVPKDFKAEIEKSLFEDKPEIRVIKSKDKNVLIIDNSRLKIASSILRLV